MRIAVDAMGGDVAPRVPVRGALEALNRIEGDIELLLVGEPEAIRRELRGQKFEERRLRIVPASEVIGMGEPPVEAVRRKQDSSIVRAVGLQESGEADALISAGSTGAILAASMLILGPLPGTTRPAIGALLPSLAAHPTLLLDAGANVDCRPQQLVEFAHLGHTYARDMLGCETPRIALLNIGEEAAKGDELTARAYPLLERSGLNFVGNAEGRDIITGVCDVLVCDGFVGNVVLKFYESVAGHMAELISRAVAGAALNVDLHNICRVLDYSEYGGAPLLGVDGVTIICHGDSPPRAIRQAVHVALRSVETNMVEHLKRELAGLTSARA